MNRPASSGLHRRLRPLVVVTSLMALATMMTMTFSLPPFARPAHAALGTFGPIDPATKFPFYYQDARGLRLGYCFDPVKCFLGAQLPNPAQPPSVPNNFPAEMFYWDADATMPTNNGGQAFMRLGLEAAFLPGPGVVDGQQVTFGRIRFRLDNLQAGATYTITHPYGVDTFVAQAGGRRGLRPGSDDLLHHRRLRSGRTGSRRGADAADPAVHRADCLAQHRRCRDDDDREVPGGGGHRGHLGDPDPNVHDRPPAAHGQHH